MSTEVQVAIPTRKIEGLAEAAEDQLEDIRSAHPARAGAQKRLLPTDWKYKNAPSRRGKRRLRFEP
jgi:hypothetical protein